MKRGFRLPRKSPAMWFDGATYATASAANTPTFSVTGQYSFFLTLRPSTLAQYSWLLDTKIAGSSAHSGFGIVMNNGLITLLLGFPFQSKPLLTMSQTTNSRIIIACDFAARAITIYLNGVQASLATLTQQPTNLANTYPLRVGTWQTNTNPTYFFRGALQAAIVEGLATSQQIAAYQRGIVPVTPYKYYQYSDITAAGGSVVGNPEQCLIHQRGAVIRTDGNKNRYIVT